MPETVEVVVQYLYKVAVTPRKLHYQRYGHGEDATDHVRGAGEEFYMHK